MDQVLTGDRSPLFCMDVGPPLSSSLRCSWAAQPGPSWDGGLGCLGIGNSGFVQDTSELRRSLIPEPGPGNSAFIPKSGYIPTIRSEPYTL